MPLVRIAGQVVFFAHVPKCAGTAVQSWLEESFGQLAFNDPKHLSQPEEDRWTRSSPQHIDRHALARLFPDDFFDACFSVVRHPVPRLISAFRFQREIEGTLPQDTQFTPWLAELDLGEPWKHDNHLRPMDDIVPLYAEIFPLENGLTPLRNRVQMLAGRGFPTLPDIMQRNVLEERLAHEGKTSLTVVPTEEDIARIADLYAVDFDRFGYDPQVFGSKP